MLLFDENISARAAAILAKDFPGARHVKDFSLLESPDSDLWHTAKFEGLTILSKDDDFLQRALFSGTLPRSSF